MNKKLLFPLLAFLTLVFAFAVQLQRNANGDNPTALESALVGKMIPEFQLTSLFDNNVVLNANIVKTGSPHLVNVWATWCPTCHIEHQYLTELAKQGVAIIGVDYKDDRTKAVAFLQERGDPYQSVIFDPNGSLGLDLGVYGAPETFIVDGNGKVLYRHAGDVNSQVWNTVLKPIYQQAK